MITTLTGANSFLLQAELRRLVTAFVSEHTDMGLEKLDGEEAAYDRMREALESLPFLAAKKLVVLRSPGINKEFSEKASELLQNLSETTDVIIVEPKLDKRTAYYKFLKKSSEFTEFNELDDRGLSQWLVQTAKEQGSTLTSADAHYLVERVGPNQRLLSNELAKLLSYNSHITRQTIELLTDQMPQSSIFDLLDAALAGRTKRAMELYKEQRSMKVDPQQILAMLAWQLHVLVVVKAAGSRDSISIAKDAKLNPYVVRKTQTAASNLTMTQLKQLVFRTYQLDLRLKSQILDADEALQELLMNIK
jgi:DNA polymerase-3 subunit delta